MLFTNVNVPPDEAVAGHPDSQTGNLFIFKARGAPVWLKVACRFKRATIGHETLRTFTTLIHHMWGPLQAEPRRFLIVPISKKVSGKFHLIERVYVTMTREINRKLRRTLKA